jgi:hypothetical protein
VADGQVARGNPYYYKVIGGKLYIPAGGRRTVTASTIKMAEREWAKINNDN